MTKFKCCNQIFANDRVYVGHRKAHHASHPHPPKLIQKQQLGRDIAESSQAPSGEEEEEEKKKRIKKAEDKSLVYGLRGNPKKSVKIANPDFSVDVDDGGCKTNESQSQSRNPTLVRSKGARKLSFGDNQEQNLDVKKMKSANNPDSVESPAAEPEQSTSVPDDIPQNIRGAMALMDLTRDSWQKKNAEQGQERSSKEGERSLELMENDVNYGCENCKKQFRSPGALAGHKKSCPMKDFEARNVGRSKTADDRADQKPAFECEICKKEFQSPRALAGHKESCSMKNFAGRNVGRSKTADDHADKKPAFECEKCKKQFQSPRALAGHKRSCSMKNFAGRNVGRSKTFDHADKKTEFPCPHCPRVFRSGQAFGGHKKIHRVNSAKADASSTSVTENSAKCQRGTPKTDAYTVSENSAKRGSYLIDLNLPGKMEDDEQLSMDSDA